MFASICLSTYATTAVNEIIIFTSTYTGLVTGFSSFSTTEVSCRKKTMGEIKQKWNLNIHLFLTYLLTKNSSKSHIVFFLFDLFI